jgi:hypothetical protein
MRTARGLWEEGTALRKGAKSFWHLAEIFRVGQVISISPNQPRAVASVHCLRYLIHLWGCSKIKQRDKPPPFSNSCSPKVRHHHAAPSTTQCYETVSSDRNGRRVQLSRVDDQNLTAIRVCRTASGHPGVPPSRQRAHHNHLHRR